MVVLEQKNRGKVAGIFITFEGGEGAGKSTQIKRLAARLEKDGHQVVLTREPGGSPGAEAVRHVLLSGAAQPFGPETEVMLFTAARIDHLAQTILPALDRNAIVLCDRFYDSTRAYQGEGDGASSDFINQMKEISVGDNNPDLTIILDIPPELGMERVTRRIAADGEDVRSLISHIDRFERDEFDVHRRRRNAFLMIAQEEPNRCVIVDASQDVNAVTAVVWSCVQPYLKQKGQHPSKCGGVYAERP